MSYKSLDYPVRYKIVQKKVCNIQTLKLVNSSILINMLNKLLCSGHCGLHMQTTTI